jgi:phosphatidylglycerol:prolipoprotein diacylglycerol transferase
VNRVASILGWWQNIPQHLDPIVFTAGSFSLRFYAVFFLLGFVAAYGLALARMKRGESPFPGKDVGDVSLWLFLGAILGARLGYGVLYDPSLLAHPLSLVSPFDAAGTWTGISGMSYFGGATLVIVVAWFLARKRNIGFFTVTDFLVPLVPLAIFFGRLGNFFNLELVGKVTTVPWGMRFPSDAVGILRHPSTLYEAVFEGLLLLVLFWSLRKKRLFPGALSSLYLIAYGTVRFFMEYFRESEGFTLWGLERLVTPGQFFSSISIVIGMLLFLVLSHRSRKNGTLER